MEDEGLSGSDILFGFVSYRLSCKGFESLACSIRGSKTQPRLGRTTSQLFSSIQNLSAPHEDQMNKLCNDLYTNRQTCASQFRKSLARVIFDGITRGRVITIVNFTAQMAIFLAEGGLEDLAADVAYVGDHFLEDSNVYQWMSENGGWDSLKGEPSSPLLSQGLSLLSCISYTMMGISPGYHGNSGEEIPAK